MDSGIFIYKEAMNKLPYTDRTEVFTMRISIKEKHQLAELAKKGKYGDTSSDVVRELIRRAQMGR
jgi:Arc/MetJ-type ribon-helix-helix transcriptional regulator